VTTYNREPRPARHNPTKEQLEAAARQQAIHEADPSYTGQQAGIHPEHRQYITDERNPRTRTRVNVPVTADDYDLEEDDAYYQTRPPTSSRRYQGFEVSPEQVIQRGNQRYHVQYVDVPPRSGQQKRLPPQREVHTDEYELAPQKGSIQQGRHYHPLVWIGLFMTMLLLGWIGLSFITSWYQGVQNDWTFGKQRHFEINAVVGHGDSQTNPSNFTAENNNGQIIVIEVPGGNVSKAKIYQIETVPGNVGNPPVKVSFQDMNGDGKVDMIVQVGDGSAMLYVTLWNNGSEFVSKL
jgi:hypothetical protein